MAPKMPLSGMDGYRGTTSQAASLPASTMVERAAAGDEVAFARLVAACHGDMVRVAYAVCGDLDMARDAVQSGWLIAWRRLRTLRDPERVRPWLVAVAANEARHLLRRRHPLHVSELAADPPDGAHVDPWQGIARVDLANALNHLSADERALLALHFAAGFDSTEIGRALGLSASGVRSRLARTIERLRKELGDA